MLQHHHPDLTVIVPTRNESDNVGPLLDRITSAAGRRTIEVLFVDDSDDDTPDRVRERAAGSVSSTSEPQVRLLHRSQDERIGGLGGAVVAGLREARADWAVVDGDLQHPPELALQLADVGRARDLDLVVATRHVEGGNADGIATLLAKAAFPFRLAGVSDPTSRLFAIRREAIDVDRLVPTGFMILTEIKVRYPRLRMAEVPFAIAARHAGESKATLAEGIRFVRHLARLRLPLFGLVGLSGLVVNTAVLLLALQVPQLHYLIGAVLATITLVVWFVVADFVINRRGRDVPTRLDDPMRVVVNLAPMSRRASKAPETHVNGVHVNGIHRSGVRLNGLPGKPSPPRKPMRAVHGKRYLPYRYSIPHVATIGSQVRLRELEYFRAQHLGHDTDIQVRVGPTGSALPRLRATMTQVADPPAIGYSEHFGRLGANFHVALGDPIVLTVAPPLARSPHVVYTNVLEALLRFVAASKGAMLLHAACVELDGVGMLISAETDTGKTGAVLRMVRELGAQFLSDDMTVLYADGRAGCYPKPLTICQHTLRAIGNDELTPREWRKLKLQSRLHAKEGRRFAMLLSRLNIPIMGVTALTQRVVPPPEYTVDRLLPCRIIPETTVSELFIISRGEFGAGELARADAMQTLLDITEDAYQLPPFKQLAPAVVIGGADHAELLRKERVILASALGHLRCRWISTPDFSWADEIPRSLADNFSTA